MMHTSRNPLLQVGDKKSRWKVELRKMLSGMPIMGNYKNTHGGQGNGVLLEILHD
jgi:hypothetical protein